VGPEGLVGMGCGEGVPIPTGDGSEEGAIPLSRKRLFLHEMACFGAS